MFHQISDKLKSFTKNSNKFIFTTLSLITIILGLISYLDFSNIPSAVAGAQTNAITTSTVSGFGGAGDDIVWDTKVTTGKKVLLAGKLVASENFGQTPVLLNGGGTGYVALLDSTGKIIERIVRFTDEVGELELAPNGNIIAVSKTGLFVFDPTLTNILWQKSFTTTPGLLFEAFSSKIDVAPNGNIALLVNKIATIYDSTGAQISTATYSDTRVEDIAIDNNGYYITGFNQSTSGPCAQIQLVYIRAYDMAGAFRWKAYGWSHANAGLDAKGVTASGANCADTRGVKLEITPQGKMVFAARSEGGNTVVRWQTNELYKSIIESNQDYSSNASGVSSNPISTIVLIDPVTGLAERNLVNSSRLSNATGNAFVVNSLDVDQDGEIFLAATSAAFFESRALQTIDGVAMSPYWGYEAVHMQLSKNLEKKRFLSSFNGTTCTSNTMGISSYNGLIAVGGDFFKANKTISGVVTASTCNKMLLNSPIQATSQGGIDGFYGVFGDTGSGICPTWKTVVSGVCSYNVPNQEPTIAITNLTQNQRIPQNQILNINVTTSDPENRLRKVLVMDYTNAFMQDTGPVVGNKSYLWGLPITSYAKSIGFHKIKASALDESITPAGGGFTVYSDEYLIEIIEPAILESNLNAQTNCTPASSVLGSTVTCTGVFSAGKSGKITFTSNLNTGTCTTPEISATDTSASCSFITTAIGSGIKILAKGSGDVSGTLPRQIALIDVNSPATVTCSNGALNSSAPGCNICPTGTVLIAGNCGVCLNGTIVSGVCVPTVIIYTLGNNTYTTATPLALIPSNTNSGSTVPNVVYTGGNVPNGTVATLTIKSPTDNGAPSYIFTGQILNGNFVANSGQSMPSGLNQTGTNLPTPAFITIPDNGTVIGIPVSNFTVTVPYFNSPTCATGQQLVSGVCTTIYTLGNNTNSLLNPVVLNPSPANSGSTIPNINFSGGNIPNNQMATLTIGTVVITGNIISGSFIPATGQTLPSNTNTTGSSVPAVGIISVLNGNGVSNVSPVNVNLLIPPQTVIAVPGQITQDKFTLDSNCFPLSLVIGENVTCVVNFLAGETGQITVTSNPNTGSCITAPIQITDTSASCTFTSILVGNNISILAKGSGDLNSAAPKLITKINVNPLPLSLGSASNTSLILNTANTIFIGNQTITLNNGYNVPLGTIGKYEFSINGTTYVINGTFQLAGFVPNSGQIFPTSLNQTNEILIVPGVISINDPLVSLPLTVGSTMVIPAVPTVITPDPINPTPTGTSPVKLKITDPYICGGSILGSILENRQILKSVTVNLKIQGGGNNEYTFSPVVDSNGNYEIPVQSENEDLPFFVAKGNYTVVYFATDINGLITEPTSYQANIQDKKDCPNSKQPEIVKKDLKKEVAKIAPFDLIRSGGFGMEKVISATMIVILLLTATKMIYKKFTGSPKINSKK